MKQLDNHTLSAWIRLGGNYYDTSGLLVASIAEFALASAIVMIPLI